MATLEQLEQGVRKAYESGNMEYARILGAELMRARQDITSQIPGTQVTTPAPKPEPTIGETVKGALEAAGTLATGATTGLAGTIVGGLGGIGESILDGTFGTKQGVKTAQQRASELGGALTMQPETEVGRNIVEGVAEAVDFVPPVVPIIGQAGALTSGIRGVAPIVQGTATQAAQGAKRIATELPQKIREKLATQERVLAPASVGARGVDVETLREGIGQDLPVPIDLTKGQRSRDFGQTRFERETAKDPEMGAPLRERFAEQNKALLMNFDSWIDQTGAEAPDLLTTGKVVTSALRDRAKRDKLEIRQAYKQAEEAGDLESEVSMPSLVNYLNESRPDEATAPLLITARNRAISLGIAQEDANGNLVPLPTTLKNAERYRQSIGMATNQESTNIRQSTIIKGLLDEETDGLGGNLYREARRKRENYAKRYENRALIADLLETKRGTTDRKVAYEDVFRKSILNGSREDVSYLRSVLQNAGDDGQQAWRELQGATLRDIRDKAARSATMDMEGSPVVSADKLNGAINALDRDGKLDLIFGKKGSEQLRDINTIAKLILTVPPGAVNTSNTATVMSALLDTVLIAGGGIPVPIASSVRFLSKQSRDRKIRRQVEDALKRMEKTEQTKQRKVL